MESKIQIANGGDFVSIALNMLEPGESVQQEMFDVNARRIKNKAVKEYMRRNDPGDVVYFVQDQGPDGFIKIGRSSSFGFRLAALQSNNPYGVEVLCLVPGGRDLEITLHEMFANHRFRREWFYPAPEILEFIRQSNQV